MHGSSEVEQGILPWKNGARWLELTGSSGAGLWRARKEGRDTGT